MKSEHTKPFDLNSAKAGAPYCQRNGLAARVGIWDAVNDYQLAGVKTTRNGKESPSTWTNEGRFHVSDPDYTEDLVMTPLGYCEGKPVFAGDELVSIGKTQFKVPPEFGSHFELYKWPRTKPVIPAYKYTGDPISFKLENYITNQRAEIEAYWKELDIFNGVKA